MTLAAAPRPRGLKRNNTGLLVCLVALYSCPGLADEPKRADSSSKHLTVATFAGNGEPGMRDGPAAMAQFLMPVAIAQAPDKSILIVDQGGQRIRRYASGQITTVAGSGAVTLNSGHVPGSYKDGAALSAGFNEPTGIAIGPDGAAYITDELNSCIRKLAHGEVSTYAGSPARRGSQDGDLSTATFSRPRAISIAKDGSIFIADYGVGIRRISRDGIVSTLETPKTGARHFVGVAATGVEQSLKLLVTEDNGLYYVLRPAVNEANVFNGAEGGEFPRAYAVTAANDFEFVATDLSVNGIRLFRLEDKPQVTQVAVPIIAGSATLEPQNSGGFADGPLLNSKFYSPLGIAIADGDVIVADSGNRRIRSFPLPDLRRPVGTNLNELRPDHSHYRILMIGASHSFWATDWQSSIPGLVEAGLKKDAATLGFPKPVSVSVARIDSAGAGVQADYLTNFVSSGQVDLVVMMLAGPDILAVSPKPGESAKDASVRTFSDLRKTLADAGTTLLVNVRPEVSAVSTLDDIFDRENASIPTFNGADGISAEESLDEGILRGAGISYYMAIPLYLDYQLKAGKLPLWSFQDSHENLTGRVFAAAQMLKQIELAKPWIKK